MSAYILWLETMGEDGVEIGASAMDLRGAQLPGISMKSLYFISTDMRDCLFDGCDFSNSELRGAFVNSASFVESNFYKVDFSECSGEAAVFTRASLVGADFYECELAGSIFRDAFLNGSSMHGTDLRRADLRGAWFGPRDVAGWTTMSSTKLADCDVTDAGGCIKGSADIGPPGEPCVVIGEELSAWFTQRGAPAVEIIN